MELDKRIIEGKKPLSAFDELESKYIGTDCFFSDKPSDFADLSKCQVGKLMSLDAVSGMFGASKNNSYAVFYFCLPCEWAEEKKEAKYRPYTITEFVNTYSLGDVIVMRPKVDTSSIRHKLFIEYIENDTGLVICLGGFYYSFNDLFKDFEIRTNEGWKPFGIKE